MRTIENYMDAARAAHDIPSDRQLARALGIGPTATTHWRTRRAWPADATMVRLADLARVDPAEALLELNCWRSDSPTVRSVYDRIAHRLAATAASIIVAYGVAGSGTTGSVETAARPTGTGTLHIMENKQRNNWVKYPMAIYF